MTIKVRNPRQRRGSYPAQASERTQVGEVADRVAEALAFGPGEHRLAHDGQILQREFRVLDAINYLGAKPEFELVLG